MLQKIPGMHVAARTSAAMRSRSATGMSATSGGSAGGMLMGAGFKPIQAAGLALIANTSPVAFGALGTPINMLTKVTLPAGIEFAAWEMRLSQMAGRQLRTRISIKR